MVMEVSCVHINVNMFLCMEVSHGGEGVKK